MDIIRFDRKYLPDERLDVVDIVINGLSLVDLVRAHEQQFAVAEGHPNLAGSYSGIPVRAVAPPARLFLGEPEGMFGMGGKVIQVLQCTCCEPGCHPLVCCITVHPDRVVWSAFEQPNRNGEFGGPVWNYDAFGPFEFERKQYEGALAALASGSTP